MRILVFSHVRLFGEALADCISLRSSTTDVVSCYVADALADEVNAVEPDVLLFDLTSEVALAEARAVNIACPDTPIVALALPEIPEEVIACADAGFVGYVPRHASIQELLDTVRFALKGECRCPPQIAGSLLREIRRRRSHAASEMATPLTSRECEVLQLLAKGLANKEIARELKLSVATVKNHLHSIFGKLNIKCRAEALVKVRNEPWLARSA